MGLPKIDDSVDKVCTLLWADVADNWVHFNFRHYHRGYRVPPSIVGFQGALWQSRLR